MEMKISAFIFVLLYTAYCSPTDSNDFDMDGDYNVQNDDVYPENYDNADETVEESKMPEKPLQITTPEQEFIKDIGETIVLPCEISGGNYVLMWKKSQNVLFQEKIKMAGTPNNMKLLSDGSLEVSNLHVQDAGEYACTAMDTKTNSPTIKHTVILRVPPQIDVLVSKDNATLLKNGDTLILTCRASGYPKPVISWHKGSSRIDIQGDVLQIANVKHHDAGTYKCLADNKIGEPAFSSINIKVEFKPVITIEKITVSSESQSETELECLVHSEPRAQVVWLKDGHTIVNNERVQLITNEHKHNLILRDIRDSDFGVYTCSATNFLGTSKKNINLVATPAVYRFTKTQTDAKVILTWDVQSKSNISVYEMLYRKKGESEWKKVQPEVNVDVTPLENDIYEVKHVFHKGLDPGDYELKFRCQNQKGWSEFSNNAMAVEVFAKHGHHKSHKKGHKHGKERQVTPTPTLASQPDVPAEHQENQSGLIKESPSTATDTSGGLVAAPRILLLGAVLFTFLQVRLASMRI